MCHKRRVRFAPSPTGPLHIGGVRTALYNYLYAKQQGGDFILRIEDTDSARFVPGAEEYIQETFDWLGLQFDESPRKGGSYGPYKQSQRREIYKEHVKLLLEKGAAYIAFDTPEELDAKRSEIPNFQYDASTRNNMRNSLTLTEKETDLLIKSGMQYVVRIKIEPDNEIIVDDMIRGKVAINSSVVDDKVIYKSSDELPTYHLANVVDDHLMEITHVIRGEEWLPSAPLHVWLYKSFGWEEAMPRFAHLPLLLKPEGSGKLSKRDGDRLGFPVFPLEWRDPVSGEVSSGYRESGYLPEAVINFLAFLGWNPGTEKEIFSLEELVQAFSFERCSKSGAKFDVEKAKWYNHQYILHTSNNELAGMFAPILLEKGVNAPAEKVVKVVALVKDRVHFVKELWDQSSYFFVAPAAYDEKTIRKRWKKETPGQMKQLIGLIENMTDFSAENQEKAVMDWIKNNCFHTGNIMNAFRLAIVGVGKGPHMFNITEVIGKEETLSRLQQAIDTIPVQENV
ncbi:MULTISPECIES: glutamate--tRNA ligase [Proteiniphilum]|uniref:glutamate--tRNA ligase n=1 Tax=Proteiniphilum TaxID=294702 RepID=UPI001EEB1770|nr:MULTISPECIES: glutamate--tRNA ligase [Proteiniphilum]MDD4778771.1 glutamate--tRNA ligase [Fermentimonas sp.]ULB35812.1 glutamate--tRNA ligase [Proteiniphilum propionicum]